MERFWTLSTGETIRIRRLSPGLRIRLAGRTGEKPFLQRLVCGTVSPRLTRKKADALLRKNPFRAVEMVRAIQQFTEEIDSEEFSTAQIQQEKQFLQTISLISKTVLRNGTA